MSCPQDNLFLEVFDVFSLALHDALPILASWDHKSNSNGKKGACNEARISEEEDVGIHNSRRKGYSEHTNEESNGKSSDEEENQLPKCVRKGDAENLNEKKRKTLMKRNRLEYISVGEKIELINIMRK